MTANLTWKTRRSGRCPKYFSLSLYYGHSWQSNIMHHHSDRQSAPFLAATAKFSAKMARWEPYLGARECKISRQSHVTTCQMYVVFTGLWQHYHPNRSISFVLEVSPTLRTTAMRAKVARRSGIRVKSDTCQTARVRVLFPDYGLT